MPIIVYNREVESHQGDNNYRIYRPYLLSNPYTHIRDRETKAQYVVSNRDEAIKEYSKHFDRMYRTNKYFKEIIDELYERYKAGETLYLECYCSPQPCHGDIIREKLEQRAVKEQINLIRERRKNNE